MQPHSRLLVNFRVCSTVKVRRGWFWIRMEFYLFRLLRTHRSINLYVVEVYVPCAKIKLNNTWFAKLFNVVLRSSFDFAWSKSFKDREFSDNVESEFDEFKLSRSQNTIYRHDLEGYDSLLIFLLGFLALLVDHVYETLILIDVEFGHVCDFDVDFHVTVTLQTVEVNIVLLHLQIMLFKCAFVSTCRVFWRGIRWICRWRSCWRGLKWRQGRTRRRTWCPPLGRARSGLYQDWTALWY